MTIGTIESLGLAEVLIAEFATLSFSTYVLAFVILIL